MIKIVPKKAMVACQRMCLVNLLCYDNVGYGDKEEHHR